MRKSALAWLLLLVVFGASACGSNPAKDRRAFLAQANSICSHYQALQNAVQFPTVNPLAAHTSHADRARWGIALRQIANLGRDEVRSLQRLKPPKDLRARFQTMVETKSGAFDKLGAGADAARQNQRTEIKPPIAAARKKLARAATLAKELGVPRCE